MKLEKKHIIVIIVILVATFILWKKGLFKKSSSASPAGGSTSGVDLDYILSHIAFSGDQRGMIEECRQKYTTPGTSTYQSLSAKAYESGRSFAQELCVTAMWHLYDNKKLSWTEYSNLVAKIDSL